jgi:hypothetical protein
MGQSTEWETLGMYSKEEVERFRCAKGIRPVATVEVPKYGALGTSGNGVRIGCNPIQ